MLFVVLSTLLTLAASESTLTWTTSLGKIKAISTSVNDGNSSYNIRIFRNIPYAKAPVGELRFKQPVPFGNWSGIRDGTQFGPSCIQPKPNPIMSSLLPNHNQSEDCLQLNIYAPLNASISKKAVMIWIHGGAYTTGQGIVYDGGYLAGIGDVVVVTINYRLNVFGFLSTNDDFSPGNYGLWDQQLALRWVHDNIGDYGGDNKLVTIFGESAGGFSVGLQALNPTNKGLFQRVIAQSGVGNSLLATSPIAKYATQVFANFTNCPSDLNLGTMNCLRNKTSQELLEGFLSMTVWVLKRPELHIEIGFAPVVDNHFMNKSPQAEISSKGPGFEFYTSLDVVIGNCESEGSLLISALKNINATNKLKNGIPFDYLCNNIISTLVSDYYNNRTRLIQPICDQYKTTHQSMSAVNFYGDVFFYSPTVYSLVSHATSSNKSHFQYMSKRYSMFSVSQLRAKWFIGAGHASELPFQFPLYGFFNMTTDDRTNSLVLLKYWSNFAKTGNVNGDGLPNWPLFDLPSQSFVVIDVNVTIQQQLYKERVNFWLQTFPGLLHQTTALPVSTELTSHTETLTSELPTIVSTTKHHNNGNNTHKTSKKILTFVFIMLFNILEH